jgi:hypothetical protein
MSKQQWVFPEPAAPVMKPQAVVYLNVNADSSSYGEGTIGNTPSSGASAYEGTDSGNMALSRSQLRDAYFSPPSENGGHRSSREGRVDPMSYVGPNRQATILAVESMREEVEQSPMTRIFPAKLLADGVECAELYVYKMHDMMAEPLPKGAVAPIFTAEAYSLKYGVQLQGVMGHIVDGLDMTEETIASINSFLKRAGRAVADLNGFIGLNKLLRIYETPADGYGRYGMPKPNFTLDEMFEYELATSFVGNEPYALQKLQALAQNELQTHGYKAKWIYVPESMTVNLAFAGNHVNQYGTAGPRADRTTFATNGYTNLIVDDLIAVKAPNFPGNTLNERVDPIVAARNFGEFKIMSWLHPNVEPENYRSSNRDVWVIDHKRVCWKKLYFKELLFKNSNAFGQDGLPTSMFPWYPTSTLVIPAGGYHSAPELASIDEFLRTRNVSPRAFAEIIDRCQRRPRDPASSFVAAVANRFDPKTFKEVNLTAKGGIANGKSTMFAAQVTDWGDKVKTLKHGEKNVTVYLIDEEAEHKDFTAYMMTAVRKSDASKADRDRCEAVIRSIANAYGELPKEERRNLDKLVISLANKRNLNAFIKGVSRTQDGEFDNLTDADQLEDLTLLIKGKPRREGQPKSEIDLAEIENALKAEGTLCKSAFLWMYDNHVPILIDLLGMSVRIRYAMGAIVVCCDTVGFTFFQEPVASIFSGGISGDLYLKFELKAGPHVTDAGGGRVYPNALAKAYISGGECIPMDLVFAKKNNYQDFADDTNEINGDDKCIVGDMYIVPIGPGELINQKVIDLTGRFIDQLVQIDDSVYREQLHYSTAAAAAEYWGWKHPDVMPIVYANPDDEVAEDQANTRMRRGQVAYDSYTADGAVAERAIIYPGDSVFGRNQHPDQLLELVGKVAKGSLAPTWVNNHAFRDFRNA